MLLFAFVSQLGSVDTRHTCCSLPLCPSMVQWTQDTRAALCHCVPAWFSGHKTHVLLFAIVSQHGSVDTRHTCCSLPLCPSMVQWTQDTRAALCHCVPAWFSGHKTHVLLFAIVSQHGSVDTRHTCCSLPLCPSMVQWTQDTRAALCHCVPAWFSGHKTHVLLFAIVSQHGSVNTGHPCCSLPLCPSMVQWTQDTHAALCHCVPAWFSGHRTPMLLFAIVSQLGSVDTGHPCCSLPLCPSLVQWTQDTHAALCHCVPAWFSGHRTPKLLFAIVSQHGSVNTGHPCCSLPLCPSLVQWTQDTHAALCHCVPAWFSGHRTPMLLFAIVSQLGSVDTRHKEQHMSPVPTEPCWGTLTKE